jgi:hypothetical protein
MKVGGRKQRRRGINQPYGVIDRHLMSELEWTQRHFLKSSTRRGNDNGAPRPFPSYSEHLSVSMTGNFL